ncbi:unnamed protein product [Prunus armeniaca]
MVEFILVSRADHKGKESATSQSQLLNQYQEEQVRLDASPEKGWRPRKTPDSKFLILTIQKEKSRLARTQGRNQEFFNWWAS